MSNQEYLTVTEISNHYNVSKRNIRRIINKLCDETSDDMLYKDSNGYWMVHRLKLPMFRPQRIRSSKYYALTIDPCSNHNEKEIDVIMNFIADNIESEKLEINYTVETKKSNGKNHIHCFIKTEKKKSIIELVRYAFSSVSYKENKIFDLEGWKKYITKDGSQIKTINNGRKGI